ncbi:MAG: hypothetical protein EOP04_02025 [Proteobacteria bacterium]|nr:MAG: hypothetical protein EOP04_02025 [Pseudomonadota bacterium]
MKLVSMLYLFTAVWSLPIVAKADFSLCTRYGNSDKACALYTGDFSLCTRYGNADKACALHSN